MSFRRRCLIGHFVPIRNTVQNTDILRTVKETQGIMCGPDAFAFSSSYFNTIRIIRFQKNRTTNVAQTTIHLDLVIFNCLYLKLKINFRQY